jgi:superfamily II DNA or RNA helicase
MIKLRKYQEKALKKINSRIKVGEKEIVLSICLVGGKLSQLSIFC